MDPQKLARACGVLFLITFATSIPALLLYDPILKDNGYATYLAGGGADNRIFLGSALEVFLILANVGTALVLFPVLRRFSEVLALGYVAWRIVECVFIGVGVLALLAVVTLRQDASGDAVAASQALVAVKDWTFLLGPGFMTGVGTGLTLGYMMYRTGLVPRRATYFGLAGGSLIVLSGLLAMFGVIGRAGEVQFFFSVPEIIWELFLGIYLTWKGFRPAPIIADDLRGDAVAPVAPQPA